eukprot:gene7538-5317_t
MFSSFVFHYPRGLSLLYPIPAVQQKKISHFFSSTFSNFNCPSRKTPEEITRLLNLIVDHIEQNPEDTAEWDTVLPRSSRSPGGDLLSLAAKHGHLSAFVGVLLHQRQVPFFVSKFSISGNSDTEPRNIRITHKAQWDDVKRLRLEDYIRFQFDEGVEGGKIMLLDNRNSRRRSGIMYEWLQEREGLVWVCPVGVGFRRTRQVYYCEEEDDDCVYRLTVAEYGGRLPVSTGCRVGEGRFSAVMIP